MSLLFVGHKYSDKKTKARDSQRSLIAIRLGSIQQESHSIEGVLNNFLTPFHLWKISPKHVTIARINVQSSADAIFFSENTFID